MNCNRRAAPRHELELPVHFRGEMLDFRGQAEFLPGEIRDVSTGGFFVRSEFLEVPGALVRLLVHLPRSDQPLFFEGHVAWIVEESPKGPGMGIKLAGSPLSAEQVRQFFTTEDPRLGATMA